MSSPLPCLVNLPQIPLPFSPWLFPLVGDSTLLLVLRATRLLRSRSASSLGGSSERQFSTLFLSLRGISRPTPIPASVSRHDLLRPTHGLFPRRNTSNVPCTPGQIHDFLLGLLSRLVDLLSLPYPRSLFPLTTEIKQFKPLFVLLLRLSLCRPIFVLIVLLLLRFLTCI